MAMTNGRPKLSSDSDYASILPEYQDLGRVNTPTSRSRKRGARVPPWKRFKGLVLLIALVGSFFVFNWWMLCRISHAGFVSKNGFFNKNPSSSVIIKEHLREIIEVKKPQYTRLRRLLKLAAHALAEGLLKSEPKGLWEEPYALASSWKPCADERDWHPSEGNNGYIMITANGGLNQQRVAVCNAVAISRLLNATLVVPKFFLSSVWRDARVLCQVTDEDIMKEAKPSFYLKNILPILIKNKVVHFHGFGNRLAFDPIPFQLQRLRCRCNFHALQFAPKIQKAGALILQRLRQDISYTGSLDNYLVGSYAKTMLKEKRSHVAKDPRYLALHLRFEIDMVAHSLCEFGGHDEEQKELEAYREIHFPALTLLKKTRKLPTPAELRSEGLCPLTPEEAVLMLAALGFNRKTHIFLAGAQIYGGPSRLAALRSLYPHLVTKEDLLSTSELEPFKNFSSQLAALDYIGCTAASAFAMTDSGSQLSALVAGHRMYYGGGRMPTIRPNKRRLADIFAKNSTIQWKIFEQRVRKAVRQTKEIHRRPTARSIYRHPRCKECMCFIG